MDKENIVCMCITFMYAHNGILKMFYIHTHNGIMEDCSANLVIYNNIDELRGSIYGVMLGEISHIEKQILYYFTYCFCCSVTKSCPTLCDPIDCSTPGLPVHHQHPEFTQTHVHWVSDAIQPSHPLSSSSPPTFNLSQHQGLFQWVGSSYQVAKVLGLQLPHESFQWIFRVDFL